MGERELQLPRADLVVVVERGTHARPHDLLHEVHVGELVVRIGHTEEDLPPDDLGRRCWVLGHALTIPIGTDLSASVPTRSNGSPAGARLRPTGQPPADPRLPIRSSRRTPD